MIKNKALAISLATMSLIFISCTAFCLETLPQFDQAGGKSFWCVAVLVFAMIGLGAVMDFTLLLCR